MAIEESTYDYLGDGEENAETDEADSDSDEAAVDNETVDEENTDEEDTLTRMPPTKVILMKIPQRR